jgi:hypothetical protein
LSCKHRHRVIELRRSDHVAGFQIYEASSSSRPIAEIVSGTCRRVFGFADVVGSQTKLEFESVPLEIRTGTPGRSSYMTDRSGALHRTMSLGQMTKLENNTSLAIPLSSFFCSCGKLALPALAWASSPLHPFVGEVLAGLD